MTSEVDTRQVERDLRMAAISVRENGGSEDEGRARAFERAAQAIAQERAARERAEALLKEAIQTLNHIAQWDQGPAGPGHDEPSSAEAAQEVLKRLNTTDAWVGGGSHD
jgi:hypothetical protein